MTEPDLPAGFVPDPALEPEINPDVEEVPFDGSGPDPDTLGGSHDFEGLA